MYFRKYLPNFRRNLNSWILKMGTWDFSERLLNFYRNKRPHSPEEITNSHKLTTYLNDSAVFLIYALSLAYQEITRCLWIPNVHCRQSSQKDASVPSPHLYTVGSLHKRTPVYPILICTLSAVFTKGRQCTQSSSVYCRQSSQKDASVPNPHLYTVGSLHKRAPVYPILIHPSSQMQFSPSTPFHLHFTLI
jgi:hypothetical protein